MKAPLLALSLVAALTVTACTGGSSEDTSSAAPAVAQDSAAGGGGVDAGSVERPVPEGGALSATKDGVEPAPPEVLSRVVPSGQSLIRTGELHVRVDDVRSAATRAGELVRAAGGGVEAEQTGGTPEDGSSTLTLRVPPDRYDALVGQLAGLGEERSRSLGTTDVSDQVVDLDSRVATQRASVERVRALLAEAKTLGEVVQVESELTRREADLESLQARLAALTTQVDLGTLVLHLDSGDPDEPAEDGQVGFLDGLRGGWEAFLTTASVLAATVGAVLPFLPVLLIGLLVARHLRSRRTASASGA